MSELLWWVPLSPALAGAYLAIALVTRVAVPERTATWIASVGLGLGAVVAAVLALTGDGTWASDLGPWIAAPGVRVDAALRATPGTLWTACWAQALTLGVVGASSTYMHREPGFTRLHAGLSLFGAALALLALAADFGLVFVAWEIAGACSVLLIAFYPERRGASDGALRALITGRIGDVALLAGWVTLLAATGASALPVHAPAWPVWLITLVAAGVAVAGAVKTALLPFSAWLARAVEGPTPTTALFYGGLMPFAGLLLLVRLSPVVLASPPVRVVLAVLVGLTLVHGVLGALTQPDAKRTLALQAEVAAALAVGLVVVGLPSVALALLPVAVTVQVVRLLLASGFLHYRAVAPPRPVGPVLAAADALRTVALARFGVERLDAVLAAPTEALSAAAQRIEELVVAPLHGAARPVLDAVATAVEHEERWLEPALEAPAADRAARSLVAYLAHAASDRAHAFESVVVAGWVGDGLPRASRSAGGRLDAVDRWLQHPAIVLGAVVLGLVVMGGAA